MSLMLSSSSSSSSSKKFLNLLLLPSEIISLIFSNLIFIDFLHFAHCNRMLRKISHKISSTTHLFLKEEYDSTGSKDEDKDMNHYFSTSFCNYHLNSFNCEKSFDQHHFDQFCILDMRKSLRRLTIVCKYNCNNFSNLSLLTNLQDLEISSSFNDHMERWDMDIEIINRFDFSCLPLISLKLRIDNAFVETKSLPMTLEKLEIDEWVVEETDISNNFSFPPKLHHLYISRCCFNRKKGYVLPHNIWSAILKLSLLRYLHLGVSIQFDDDNIIWNVEDIHHQRLKILERLTQLSNLSTLTTLNISFTLMEEADGAGHNRDTLCKFCSSLSWPKNLRELTIYIDTPFLLSHSLRYVDTLKKLHMRTPQFSSEMVDAIKTLKQLTSLDLFDSGFSPSLYLPHLCSPYSHSDVSDLKASKTSHISDIGYSTHLTNLTSLRLGNDGFVLNLYLLAFSPFQTSLTELNLDFYSAPSGEFEYYDDTTVAEDMDRKIKEFKIKEMPFLPNLTTLKMGGYIVHIELFETFHHKYPNLTSLTSPICYEPFIRSAIAPMKHLHTLNLSDIEDLLEKDYHVLLSCMCSTSTKPPTMLTALRFIRSPKNERKFKKKLHSTLIDQQIEILPYSFLSI